VTDDLDPTARRAHESVATLLASVEEARAGFAEVRAQVVEATQRFDTHWAAVAERALHYLEQVAREEEQLQATREEARQAITHLRGGLAEVHEEGPREVEHAQAEFDQAAAQLAQRDPETLASVHEAGQAEDSLAARLADVQTELDESVAETEGLLAQAAAEMSDFEQELERRVVQLNAYISGECLPTVLARAQALYQRLVQAEDEVRSALEAALEATESAADRALRDCRDGFDDALQEVGKLGQALDEALFEVKLFLDGGRAKLQDRKEHWDERVRSTREGVGESLQLLKEVEAYLARFSFGR
jgi:DNA repair exonuclease SbcCD ATPase subunit